MKDNFVELSTASLRKVDEWVEKNDGDPLALAYQYARVVANGWCFMSERYYLDEAWERLRKVWPFESRSAYKFIPYLTRASDYAYKHRDTIGRLILEVIKKEGKQ